MQAFGHANSSSMVAFGQYPLPDAGALQHADDGAQLDMCGVVTAPMLVGTINFTHMGHSNKC